MTAAFDFARNLALQAGRILLGYFHPTGTQQKIKADRTVVTQADLAADELICTSIRDAYPGDGILSEEGNTIYQVYRRHVWVIDPLDGTTNFSLGLHYWGVVITRLTDGIPDLTALYFPLLDEIFSAEKGGGAWLNGEKLRVIEGDSTRKTTFFSCCSRTQRHYKVDIPYKTRILGSAAYGLCTVARQSAILAFEATPKIWDFAGSWLITEEAGGIIAPLNEEQVFPLRPGVDYQARKHPMLAAPNQDRWDFGKQRIQFK
jgi:myo-inositol-1(or 4)-monophosphatase